METMLLCIHASSGLFRRTWILVWAVTKRYEGIAVVMIEKQCNLSYYDETCVAWKWTQNDPTRYMYQAKVSYIDEPTLKYNVSYQFTITINFFKMYFKKKPTKNKILKNSLNSACHVFCRLNSCHFAWSKSEQVVKTLCTSKSHLWNIQITFKNPSN